MSATTTQSAAASAETPTARPPGALSTSVTMGYRALLRIRRAPEQLADAFLLPVVFTLLFTYLFGGALAGSTSGYLQDLLPGTLVMTVLLVTAFAGTILNADATQGRLDRFRALPIWQPSLIVGGLIGDAGRYLLASAMVIGLGMVMGFRPEGGVAGVAAGVALIMVFAFSVSWIWTTLGLVARSPQSLSVLSFVVQFPLLFASNTFVDPATMPEWLRRLVELNPVSHLVTTERLLMAGTAGPADVAGVLLGAAAITVVFAPLTMRLYRRRA
ncbi:MAG: drrB 5 [Agromyces sp.]|jgi:ABC-2 type transport system permease protein|nr:drrB 5 [Agromyces sp.]